MGSQEMLWNWRWGVDELYRPYLKLFPRACCCQAAVTAADVADVLRDETVIIQGQTHRSREDSTSDRFKGPAEGALEGGLVPVLSARIDTTSCPSVGGVSFKVKGLE